MMRIRKIGLSNPLKDNDAHYISYLVKVLETIDPECQIDILKTRLDIYDVSIVPSNQCLRDSIRDEMEELHRLLGLPIIFTSHREYRMIRYTLK